MALLPWILTLANRAILRAGRSISAPQEACHMRVVKVGVAPSVAAPHSQNSRSHVPSGSAAVSFSIDDPPLWANPTMNAQSPDLSPFLAHRSFVRNLAASLLRDPPEIDDVEQETWISAMRSPQDEVRDPRSWLRKVVQNHVRNRVRQGRRDRRREQESARTEAVDAETLALERMETARKLVSIVMKMSEPNRTTILLRFYEGHSLREAAERLGLGLAVVKGRQQRGMAELRNALGRDGQRSAEDWRRDLAALVAAPAPVKGLLATAAPWLLAAGLTGAMAAGLALSPWAQADLDAIPTAHRDATLEHKVDLASVPGMLGAPNDPPRLLARASTRRGPAASGEITLRIGDAFVFGEDQVRPDGDRSQLDLYVQDIRHGVSLGTLAGGVEPALPLSSIGLPTEPKALMALLQSAPLELPKRDLWLLEQCTVDRPGIGLAMSRQGQAYRLCLLELDGHPEALQRTVRIAYEPVPSVEGGGVLNVPPTQGKPGEAPLAALREALRIGSLIPGDSFSRYMAGDYAAVADLADGTKLKKEACVVLTGELNGPVLLHERSALFAVNGIGPRGSIDLNARGAIGVQGPMYGQIDIRKYGYVYLDGPMEGTLDLDSYATVVLERGLAGTLKLRSYGDILIRGRITGTIDAEGSCWSTIYLDNTYTEAELIAMGEKAAADMDQITLHVRVADLADGEHEGIGTWRKVIVGDPIWESLAKR